MGYRNKSNEFLILNGTLYCSYGLQNVPYVANFANFAMVNRIWPTAVAGKADIVSSVSALACHIGGPNSVNTGQILLVYGTLDCRRNKLVPTPDIDHQFFTSGAATHQFLMSRLIDMEKF